MWSWLGQAPMTTLRLWRGGDGVRAAYTCLHLVHAPTSYYIHCLHLTDRTLHCIHITACTFAIACLVASIFYTRAAQTSSPPLDISEPHTTFRRIRPTHEYEYTIFADPVVARPCTAVRSWERVHECCCALAAIGSLPHSRNERLYQWRPWCRR